MVCEISENTKMLFCTENINAIEEDPFTNIEQFNFLIDIVIKENVSEMDCESPRSSTSMDIAELNSPPPASSTSNKDGENVEENDDAASADENEVNLPPGACSWNFFFLMKISFGGNWHENARFHANISSAIGPRIDGQ